MQKNEQIQSHQMTAQQIKELQYKQQNNLVEYVPANVNPEYKIPEHEQHLVHAEVENKEFNKQTGQKVSVPRVQTFYVEEFEKMLQEKGFHGASVTVVHAPEDLKLQGGLKRVSVDASNDTTGPGNNDKLLGNAGGNTGSEGDGEGDGDGGEGGEGGEGSGLTPKQTLQAEYAVLFGEAPNEVLTKADLKKAIADKKAEQAAQ